MKGNNADLSRLKHISACLNDLHEIMYGVEENVFYASTEKKYAVERILEIIGEAINRISEETLSLSDHEIPWRDIIDFRNLVTHEYFRIDYTLVYGIVKNEIPRLEEAVHFLIEKLSNSTE